MSIRFLHHCICIIILTIIWPLAVCAQIKSSYITIVFQHPVLYPNKIEVIKKVFIEENEAPVVVSNNFHTSAFVPDTTKESDTLRILAESEYILLKHRFKTLSFLYYLFKRGDTILFNYRGGMPVAKVVNREVREYDVNYDMFWREHSGFSDKMTPYEIYLEPYFSNDVTEQLNIVNTFAAVKKRNYELSKSWFQMESDFLDSLKTNALISETYYNLFSDRKKYLSLLLDVQQLPVSLSTITSNMPVKDTMFYTFYVNYAYAAVTEIVAKQPWILKRQNGSIQDFRKAYDFIDQGLAISKKYKTPILFNYLLLIADNFSAEDLNVYRKRFLAYNVDPVFLNALKEKGLLDPHGDRSLTSLRLVDNNKVSSDLSAVLSQSNAKLFYIDFWASWCAPCRSEIASSDSARLALERHGVCVIYLSIDRTRVDWENGARELKLDKNSYLITNVLQNAFLNKIQLTSIPRYLLIDKSGNILYKNAPPPSSNELRKIIAAYL